MKYGSGKRLDKIRKERWNRVSRQIEDYDRKKERANRETSPDTIIRTDINKTIEKMLKEGASNISIKIYLANKYPDRADYIMKMIKHHNNKFNKTKSSKTSRNADGEER